MTTLNNDSGGAYSAYRILKNSSSIIRTTLGSYTHSAGAPKHTPDKEGRAYNASCSSKGGAVHPDITNRRNSLDPDGLAVEPHSGILALWQRQNT
eukprot:6215754-Pyramimonas_sp.AAC.1